MRGEARPVEIRARQAPQHQPISNLGKTSEDVGGKGGGERAVLLVAAHSQDFVQGASREPAARQSPVDRCDTKRQNPLRHCRRSLDPSDAFAKLGKKGSCRIGHVLFLFFDSPIVKTGS